MYQAPKNLKEKVLKIYKICGIVVGVWFCAWGLILILVYVN